MLIQKEYMQIILNKYYRQEQLKLAREQRKFSKMEKGSKNREKQRIKLAKKNNE